jgi:hypothetical protein
VVGSGKLLQGKSRVFSHNPIVTILAAIVMCRSVLQVPRLRVGWSSIFFSHYFPLHSPLLAMSLPQVVAYRYAKRSLLGLRLELGDIAEDPAAASEWVQVFSAALVRRYPSSRCFWPI